MWRVIAGIGVALALAVAILSLIVERESRYTLETLRGGSGPKRALVLYHPSRDARFSDDLSQAFAEGLVASGLSVDRATLTSETPPHPDGYAILGVVSNTYYWSPDRPTLNYLRRARLAGIPTVGIIGGAGSTGRAERTLGQALRRAGATVLQVRSFWLWRPNDETRPNEGNRQIALDLARQLGTEMGARAVAGAIPAR